MWDFSNEAMVPNEDQQITGRVFLFGFCYLWSTWHIELLLLGLDEGGAGPGHLTWGRRSSEGGIVTRNASRRNK